MRYPIFLFLIITVLTAGCISTTPQETESSGVQDNETETLEYDGVELTPIEEQRNNGIKGTQYIDRENYTLKISGMVNETTHISYEQLTSYPVVSRVVPLDCVEGWRFTALWTGVPVQTLLEEAGVREGANTVIFYSEDGYSTSLPLDYLIDNNIIVAYKLNNVTLPQERGFPLQLVAEGKYGYKWAKWITAIEVTDDDNYEGFWESRGYNNNADVDGPRFQ
ncbi:molybdopterin-dependent oxidoreductase [Methanohalophilus halophilus]|uniref:Oxidoreductase n=1 Tax=Methanohalophilus halophilus TaxID=2177 RepID=A0A1L3Q316_9EURY|nr:molybdopterin-dependent oxidoreductase [Methanohalophilus halophilus]APH39272.1 oxidoreductase [Methanohalophilus halophilus]RNI09665.1 oxidoreductase [Methanohalophilus halophilus]SDW51848.1 Oxidoreductase molybdopterin binding domain-containing protein [Methanohalophilus halophilus]